LKDNKSKIDHKCEELNNYTLDLKTKLESKTNHIKYVEAKLAGIESNYQLSINSNEKE